MVTLAFFDFGASARMLPSGRVATSSEHRMRFMEPLSFGWRMRDQGVACKWRNHPAARKIISRVRMSDGLSHRRPKIIVDQVPPEPIRAAAHDIACRASEVHVLAVGTCAIN